MITAAASTWQLGGSSDCTAEHTVPDSCRSNDDIACCACTPCLSLALELQRQAREPVWCAGDGAASWRADRE